MIFPVLGQSVWYYATPDDPVLDSTHKHQPLAAIVTYVYTETSVCLCVFRSDGTPFARGPVLLYQGEGDKPDSGYAGFVDEKAQISAAYNQRKEAESKKIVASALAGASNVEFTQGGAAVIASPGITVADPGVNLASATVKIGGFLAGDTLHASTGGTAIVGAYNPATGVLALLGNDTAANYSKVLQSVSFISPSDNGTNRTLDFQVSDGYLGSNVVTSTVSMAVVTVKAAPGVPLSTAPPPPPPSSPAPWAANESPPPFAPQPIIPTVNPPLVPPKVTP